jgi:hypothetical protein
LIGLAANYDPGFPDAAKNLDTDCLY